MAPEDNLYEEHLMQGHGHNHLQISRNGSQGLEPAELTMVPEAARPLGKDRGQQGSECVALTDVLY